MKCHAESMVGVDTIALLGKHEARVLWEVFMAEGNEDITCIEVVGMQAYQHGDTLPDDSDVYDQVKDAINDFLAGIPFNGRFVIDEFVTAMLAVEGVKVVVVCGEGEGLPARGHAAG